MAAKSAPSTKKTTMKKVVKLAPKAAPAAKAAKAAKAPKAAKVSSGKFTGKTSGLRVQAFQDKLMKDNYKAKLSDAALASAMRAEFPGAVAFTEAHVAGIRSQWNNGKRASQAETGTPAKRLARFDDEGEEVTSRAGRKAGADKGVVKKGAAKKAAKAAPADEDEDEDEDAEEEDDEESDDEE